jgi:thiol-disulfide isomerase/thioredoxin
MFPVGAQSISGLWDATVTVNNIQIPFGIEFSGNGSAIQGWFFNGEDRITSTAGNFADGKLTLNFDHYATKLNAELKDGVLEGTYGSKEPRIYPFRAQRHAAGSAPPAGVPSIAGIWEVAVQSPKGESAWRLLIRQSGAEVSATILRIDGDTGLLIGSYRAGKFVLSHFSGARPSLLVITARPDGGLDLDLSSRGKFTAVRPAKARAMGVAGPSDPAKHTTVKDPAERFHFSFPDLNGKIVSDADPRFQGKVVLVNITGSWCPNCHDEAPFLQELYRAYQNQGLEIVALSFEEPDQLKDPSRLRAFIRNYRIEYTVLLGGVPAELNEKLAQTVNLNSWPTTFFLGRDGRVRHVHAGFPGRASGEWYRESREDFTTTIESLLAEDVRSPR